MHFVIVPHIQGLRIDDFMNFGKQIPEVFQYLPDERDWHHPDREWICNVFNSVAFE